MVIAIFDPNLIGGVDWGGGGFKAVAAR